MSAQAVHQEVPSINVKRPPINLVLWNIDLTLVDVAIVSREAYADAFRRVTGQPLMKLSPTAGRLESEIIFETLAVNGIPPSDDHLPAFVAALTDAFQERRDRLRAEGRDLPGAASALKAVSRLEGVVQSVLTGTIKPNAIHKLAAFRLDDHLDVEVGGYGEEPFPRATLLQVAQGRVTEKYGGPPRATVLIADSVRDVQAAKITQSGMIAVASGRSTVAELREAGADVVLADLNDTNRVVEAVTMLTGV